MANENDPIPARIKDYGEPWFMIAGMVFDKRRDTKKKLFQFPDRPEDHWGTREDLVIPHRVLACVNALAGCPDPELFVKQLVAMMHNEIPHLDGSFYGAYPAFSWLKAKS